MEKPQEIHIETIPFVKKPCDICGELENSEMYFSGPFRWLCPKCSAIAEKVIRRYLDSLMYQDFRFVIASLWRHLDQTHCAYCHGSLEGEGHSSEKYPNKTFCNKDHTAEYEKEQGKARLGK